MPAGTLHSLTSEVGWDNEYLTALWTLDFNFSRNNVAGGLEVELAAIQQQYRSIVTPRSFPLVRCRLAVVPPAGMNCQIVEDHMGELLVMDCPQV